MPPLEPPLVWAHGNPREIGYDPDAEHFFITVRQPARDGQGLKVWSDHFDDLRLSWRSYLEWEFSHEPQLPGTTLIPDGPDGGRAMLQVLVASKAVQKTAAEMAAANARVLVQLEQLQAAMERMAAGMA